MKKKFVTKDSGERVDYPTGARRDLSRGKPRFDLISPFGLRRVAELMSRGAEKYGEGNWERGIPPERCYESMIRHAFQYQLSKEDGEDHLAAVVFNALAIMHYQETGNTCQKKSRK